MARVCSTSLQGRLWSHVRTLDDANSTNDALFLFLPQITATDRPPRVPIAAQMGSTL